MRFNKSHVKYVLDRFDSGVSPHQILLDLQSRDYLPSLTVAIIEQCIRDNGRVLPHQQAGGATQGNQPPEVDQASPPLSPASQGAPGPSKNIRGSGQRRVRFAEGTFAESSQSPLANTPNTFPESSVGITAKTHPATFKYLEDSDSRVLWDYETEKCVLDAYNANKSIPEIWNSVRLGLGFDIALQDILDSMIRQGLHVKPVQEKGSKEKSSGHESQKGNGKEHQKEKPRGHESRKGKGKERAENQ